jgi:hypothetical protein
LDEVILKCTFSRLMTLPSFLKLNEHPPDGEAE